MKNILLLVTAVGDCGLWANQYPRHPRRRSSAHVASNAFNSADHPAAGGLCSEFAANRIGGSHARVTQRTGGFDLLPFESPGGLLIKFRVKEKVSAATSLGTIKMKTGDSPVIESFGLRALSPGAVVEDVNLGWRCDSR